MNEENKGEIAVVDTTAPSPIANQFDIVDVKAAKAFSDNYKELVDALLDDTDYQLIQGKKAKKKSAWRKLATAFNISDSVIHHEETRDETGQIVSAKFFVKAVLPNGRSAVAIGECSIYDKIRYRSTPLNSADKDTPSNFVLRGRFSNAEHDVPATAHTRAKSRAIADLIGYGENSAEEFGDDFPSGQNSNSNGKKNGKKRRKTASKKESNVVETKAEVVEAEVVTEPEIVKDEKPADETPKEKKAKKKTIKTLKEEYSEINNVIEKLQADKKKVTRENILEALMDAYESDEITLSDYQILKKELTQ